MNIAETVELYGYATLQNYFPDLTSEQAFNTIGTIEKVDGFGLIQKLTPKQINESPPNTYSGNFGTLEFPLHTDLAHWNIPPKYIALRCIKGSLNVYTRLLVIDDIISTIGKSYLQSALAQPRRPINKALHLLRLLDRQSQQKLDILRWDEIFIKPATEKSRDKFDLFKKLLSKAEILEVCLFNHGDTLIIDNWRCLHGRSHALNCPSRHIDRAYLSSIHTT